MFQKHKPVNLVSGKVTIFLLKETRKVCTQGDGNYFDLHSGRRFVDYDSKIAASSIVKMPTRTCIGTRPMFRSIDV